MQQLLRDANAIPQKSTSNLESRPRTILGKGGLKQPQSPVRTRAEGVKAFRNNLTIDEGLRKKHRRKTLPNRTDEKLKQILTALVENLKATRAAERDVVYTVCV
ncbi:hypothetical protein YTPLAS72_01590 [Nitrospira sp.]|nr:hypothetical protein YTPLAS72_01590 [Nitrospira sp.]